MAGETHGRGRRVAGVGEDSRLASSGSVLLNHRTPAAPPELPSWGRVLATTIKLWVLRRWRIMVGVVAAAALVVAALGFGGVFFGSAAPAARASSAGEPSKARTAPHLSAAGPAEAAAAAQAQAQAQAATWIAGQVSGNATIACDQAMCAALQARGVTAGRLVPLSPGSADPGSATLMVTASASDSQYAPAVIATFGSGPERVEVRATEPGGAGAYESALRADLQARMSAGAQLLRNDRIRFTTQDAAQLRAGEVDTRVLATLAALSSQYPFTVTAFLDAAPGAALLYRGVIITGAGRTELNSALALVQAQQQPYLPVYAAIVHPDAGQAALIIEFAAPSPLGLLSAVLTADPSSPPR